jgi:8-oxo-dGTP diphosphatase
MTVENMAPKYCFCPMCATVLSEKAEADGRIRQACCECGWIFFPHMAITVSAVLVEDDKVLLVKRGHEPFPGTWMFPSGFLEYGEHPEDGLLRELYEETNLKARVGRLLDICRSEDDPREPNHLAFFYWVTNASGELVNDETENEAVSWFPVDELPRIDLKNHLRVAASIAMLRPVSGA